MAPDSESKSADISKRLAVFLDGTWNAVGDNTNVWRLRSLCAPRGADGKRQLIYYDVGVNGFIGGGFGKGLQRNITDSYEWLVENYDEGDEIYIFGFSRGAFTARSLAGLIANAGIIQRGAPIGVNQLYARYKRGDPTRITLDEMYSDGRLPNPTIEERWMREYSRPTEVRMVGVWDTVGALGIPAFSIPGVSRKTFQFLETGLRRPIKHGFHAIAIDEHRRTFTPTLWTINSHKPDGTDAGYLKNRPITSVEQRWFVGAHANVGGGCLSDPLPQKPLQWIMKKASSLGLKFHRDVQVDNILGLGISDSYKEFLSGTYRFASSRYFRPIAAVLPKDDRGSHVNVNETIDETVFERWCGDSSYRPQNLVEWAQRKSADLQSINYSCLADDPTQKAL